MRYSQQHYIWKWKKPNYLGRIRQNIQPAQPTRCYRKYGSHLHLNSPTGKHFHMRLYSQSKVGLKVKFMICFAACAFKAYIMFFFFPFLPHKLLAVTPSFMLCFPVETQHLHFMRPINLFFCCCCCCCRCAAPRTCHWADLLDQSFPCRLVTEILSLFQWIFTWQLTGGEKFNGGNCCEARVAEEEV